MYASFAFGSTKIFATRPKLIGSLLPPTKPATCALACCRPPRRLAARALLADLQQELAVLGELQDVRVGAAVAADPDVALVVDEDAVVARRATRSPRPARPSGAADCRPDRTRAPAARRRSTRRSSARCPSRCRPAWRSCDGRSRRDRRRRPRRRWSEPSTSDWASASARADRPRSCGACTAAFALGRRRPLEHRLGRTPRRCDAGVEQTRTDDDTCGSAPAPHLRPRSMSRSMT